MKAITTGIIGVISFILICASAEGMMEGNVSCMITCFVSITIFAWNGDYINRHWSRIEKEIDEMFPED